MKICIDARFYQESGVGRYLRNLISSLKILDKKNIYSILLLPKDYESFNSTSNFRKVLAPFNWYGFAEQFKLPTLLNQLDLDLVHFPHFNVPVFYKGKFVVTIHDLIQQHHNMNRASTLDPFTYKIKQFGYKKVFRHAIRNSSRILVPSNFVKNGLKDEWGTSVDKISVTPEAVDDKISEDAGKIKKEQIKSVLEKWGIKPPYLFYVGNAYPHKNVEGLIKAFFSLRKKHKDLSLVLSGQDHYFWQRIRQVYKDNNIVFTGRITDWDLVAIYKHAKCFVMPSFEEGFGIPLLEAMTCGCPVVSSDAGSLKEVGGEAAIYFDPKSTEDMGTKIDTVITDNNLRDRLIKKAQDRIKIFSWQDLAKQTMEAYESCVSA